MRTKATEFVCFLLALKPLARELNEPLISAVGLCYHKQCRYRDAVFIDDDLSKGVKPNTGEKAGGQ
jgi:hypothetical protein